MTRDCNSMPTLPWRLGAALLAVHVLVVGILAVSPWLHSHVHHDCGDHEHTCAATLFAHGIDPLTTEFPSAAPARASYVTVLRLAAAIAQGTPAVRQPPSCGPPRD